MVLMRSLVVSIFVMSLPANGCAWRGLNVLESIIEFKKPPLSWLAEIGRKPTALSINGMAQGLEVADRVLLREGTLQNAVEIWRSKECQLHTDGSPESINFICFVDESIRRIGAIRLHLSLHEISAIPLMSDEYWNGIGRISSCDIVHPCQEDVRRFIAGFELDEIFGCIGRLNMGDSRPPYYVDQALSFLQEVPEQCLRYVIPALCVCNDPSLRLVAANSVTFFDEQNKQNKCHHAIFLTASFLQNTQNKYILNAVAGLLKGALKSDSGQPIGNPIDAYTTLMSLLHKEMNSTWQMSSYPSSTITVSCIEPQNDSLGRARTDVVDLGDCWRLNQVPNDDLPNWKVTANASDGASLGDFHYLTVLIDRKSVDSQGLDIPRYLKLVRGQLRTCSQREASTYELHVAILHGSDRSDYMLMSDKGEWAFLSQANGRFSSQAISSQVIEFGEVNAHLDGEKADAWRSVAMIYRWPHFEGLYRFPTTNG
jgi:hypothetical protein